MSSMLTYTGVGSRKTPPPMLVLMEALAADLRERGYTCRSGHAEGADMAFEAGARGQMELYLPWASFNGPPLHKPDLLMKDPDPAARDIAMTVHPAWGRLGWGGQSLHARNVHQVLGPDLVDRCGDPLTPTSVPATPSEFLLCWTMGGRVTGGTATAIKLAQKYGVPVYNLWFAHERARFEVEYGLRCVA